MLPTVNREPYSTRRRRSARPTELGLVLPERFCQQVVLLMKDVLGPAFKSDDRNTFGLSAGRVAGARRLEPAWSIYMDAVKELRREWGADELGKRSVIRLLQRQDDPEEEVHSFLLEKHHLSIETDYDLQNDRKLDVLEAVMLLAVKRLPRKADDAVACLNRWFAEHSLGYRFDPAAGVVQVESEVLHATATTPALRLLHEGGFESAEHEFVAALQHHRAGDARAAMVEAVRAYESVLRTICSRRGWSVDKQPTVQNLVDAVWSNGLLGTSQSTHGYIRGMLVGVGSPRNREAAHGSGGEAREVPAFLLNYQLNAVATAIRLVVEAEKELAADPG